jgi:hypothetical protein
MHTYLQASIIVVTFVVAFLLGYAVSSQTGIEPGYFEATEAAAYGSVEETTSTEGLSKEEQEYYESLTK